ncbi:hypothetical protein D3C72_2539040 [compost metagenome]
MSLSSLNVEYSEAETPAEVATSPASTSARAEPKGKQSTREEMINMRRMTVSSDSMKHKVSTT